MTKFPMARIALAEVRVNPRRLIAVMVAIAASVAYLTASASIVASESATMDRSVIARTSKADVVVTLTRADSGLVERVRHVEGVGSADLSYLSRGRVTGSSEWVQQQSVPDNPALRWSDVVEGEWPAAPDEIVLGTISAKQLNTRVGDRLTINDGNSSATLRVTGLTREGGSLLAGLAQSSFVAPSFYTGAESIRSSLQTEVLVIGDGTSTPDELAGRIKAVAAGNSVETSSAFAQRKISEQTSGVFVFELMLLVFGAIALLVGGITIVNTFLILVAQRRRQIGLLRALGTATGQIRRALLVEAAAVGLAGSLLGVLIGVAVSGIVATALDEVLTVPFGQVLASAAVGVLLAVVAVLAPARRATRIAPLEALRPVADRETERRQSRLRLVVAALLLGSGGTAIASGFGDSPYALLMSVGGLMVFATGLLVAAGFYLPLLLRLGRRLVTGLGPTARLAANNSVRNPGRAAATGAALILAVGIVVTLQVGAASMKATANSNLDSRFPVDVTVSVFDGALPLRAAADITAVPGIVDVKGLKSTRGPVHLGGTTKDLRVLAAEDVGDDEVFADPYLLRDFPADETTIVGRTSTITRPVVGNPLAPADTLIVSPAVMAMLDAGAQVGTLWAKVAPDVDITALRSRLRDVVAPITGAEVGGGLTAKVSYHEFLDRLLVVTTMLLAVAVLIALIGVGNTLGLSVLERTRESALLCALGLRRSGLRWMLAIEAVLLSVSGTAVGIAAGVFAGWVGAHAISGELNFSTVEFAMSVPQTVAVGVMACLAGVVASILPGRRAARATPVEALADH